MPRWRPAASAPRRPDGPDTTTAFEPIRVIQVDVDAPDRAVPGGGDGQLVWIEAVHLGEVVGLLEARLEDGRVPDGLLEGLDRGTSPLADVADDRLAPATVVVSTLFARPEQLERTLHSLAALDYPDVEVVVVDNRPGRPGPAPSLAAHPGVRVVEQRVPGISAGRNRGIEASDRELVAFTDDDVVVEPGWLRALGARFATEPAVDALGGLVLPTELDTAAQLWFEEYYGGFSQSFDRSTMSMAESRKEDPLFPYAPGRFGAGCNMAFRRSALDAVGGFDVTLGTGTPARGGEDLSMFINLLVNGLTIGFEPAAVVHHAHRRSEAEFLRHVRTYGTGLAAMYTSLVVRRPATLGDLARRFPAGVRLLVRPRDERSPSTSASYPRRTLAYQLAGIALGPIAYARSWTSTRRATRRAT
jgi:GT2 family glycosyltransferase